MSVQRIIYPQFERLNDFVSIVITIMMSTINFHKVIFHMERILDYGYNRVALVKIIFNLKKQSQKKE